MVQGMNNGNNKLCQDQVPAELTRKRDLDRDYLRLTVGDFLSEIEKRPSLWYEEESEEASFLWDEVSRELSRKRQLETEFSGFQLKLLWVSMRKNFNKFKAHIEKSILYQDMDDYQQPEDHFPFALDFLDDKYRQFKQKIFNGFDEHGEPIYIESDGLSQTADEDSNTECIDYSSSTFIPSYAKVGNVVIDLTKCTLNDLHQLLEREDLSKDRTDYSEILEAVENLIETENFQNDNLGNDGCISSCENNNPEMVDVNNENMNYVVMGDEIEVGNIVDITFSGGRPVEKAYEVQGIPDPLEIPVELPGPLEIPVELPGPLEIPVELPGPLEIPVELPGPLEIPVELPGPLEIQDPPAENHIEYVELPELPEPANELQKRENMWQMVSTSLKRKRAEEKHTPNKKYNPSPAMKKCLFPEMF
ncbi:uncharacterized protein LOC123682735 [Harmonia axyridis]|uniref:uncharacterized protein LOC123682735 n=1 Tax=Harmonia axyridis TaxID=115357 RepID=UPI001E27998A|nr:uncharacterized protein LOC123682735 [Harmonia axyridis]